MLLLGLVIAVPQYASAGTSVSDGKIKVLNPRGKPPDIPLASMAERSGGLAGKTVYFVDVRFMNGDIFLKELQKIFQEKYPGIKTEFRQKYGGYNEDDPKLWAEIKENNGAMVMAIGH
jgi:hypothetical protein